MLACTRAHIQLSVFPSLVTILGGLAVIRAERRVTRHRLVPNKLVHTLGLRAARGLRARPRRDIRPPHTTKKQKPPQGRWVSNDLTAGTCRKCVHQANFFVLQDAAGHHACQLLLCICSARRVTDALPQETHADQADPEGVCARQRWSQCTTACRAHTSAPTSCCQKVKLGAMQPREFLSAR